MKIESYFTCIKEGVSPPYQPGISNTALFLSTKLKADDSHNVQTFIKSLTENEKKFITKKVTQHP